ncbi:protein-tyrosine-phosphatase [Spirochaetia bacterium]|nr:protein-tyrosine-phosphatase [Spirochaetia bacterium]
MKKNFSIGGAIVSLLLLSVFSGCQSAEVKETAAPAEPEVARRAPGSLLSLEGVYNVRDLGGYRAADGKTVRWEKILRAGELDKLNPEGVALLEGIGIKTIVDFRDAGEKAAAPDAAIATVQNTIELPIEVSSLMDTRTLARAPLAQNEQILVTGNKFFVTDAQAQYKSFFAAVSDENNLPLMFHCTAGKDRAGFAAAMFLSALGVDRETVIQDYLLSGEYVAVKYAPYIAQIPNLAPIFETRREYIQAAFDTIDNEYGGTEKYLTEKLGVDMAKLKAIYLK